MNRRTFLITILSAILGSLLPVSRCNSEIQDDEGFSFPLEFPAAFQVPPMGVTAATVVNFRSLQFWEKLFCHY